MPRSGWQLEHANAPEVELPKIGELIRLNFRSWSAGAAFEVKAEGNIDVDYIPSNRPLRIVSWNIFLGINIKGLIMELSALDPAPDIVFLQEDNIFADIDAGTQCSGKNNSTELIKIN